MKAYSEAFGLAFGCNKQKIDREKAIKILEDEVKKLKEERGWLDFVTPPSPSSRHKHNPPSFTSSSSFSSTDASSSAVRETLSQCQCLLGLLLWQRRNPESSDLRDALKMGTESKDPRKYYYLAFMAKDHGDDDQARRYFQLAYSYLNDQIGKDEPWEMFMLAKLYSEKNIGLENDMKQAFILFQSSAEMGFAPAQHNLGYLYSIGVGVEKDLAESVKWYRKAASQGMASAQYNLALLFMGESGGEKDVKEAMRLLSLCAEAGYPQAYSTMSRYYETGENGIEKNTELAVTYLQKAAARGDVNAEYLLGVWLKEGKYLNQDYKEAFRWFQRAAQKGHGYGMYMVGVCLDRGLGEPENKKEAVKYYEAASNKGIAEAHYALGECYDEGAGLPQNSAEAFRLYKMAADQGLAIAQYSVGVCYENGMGMPPNNAIAALYFKKARAQGYHGPIPKSPSFSSETLQKITQESPQLMEQMLQQLSTQYSPLLALLAQSTTWTCAECNFKNLRNQPCEMCGKSNPLPPPASDIMQSLSSAQHSAAPSVSASNTNVICPVCTFQNEGGTDQCYVCGSSF